MRLLALGLAGLAGVVIGGTSCLLDLDHSLACGDGYVDPLAGEECDPADATSYANKCVTEDGVRDAICDETSCELRDSDLECAACGNGSVELDDGEECDFNVADIDDLTTPSTCVGLEPAYSDTPYTSGTAQRCLSDCTWDRKECGFCGNGNADGAEPIWVSELQRDLESRPEWCDGDDFDEQRLDSESPLACRDQGAVANVTCAANCRGFVEREGEPCCLPRDAACPADGDALRCCHEYAYPTAENHCAGSITNDDGQEPPDPDGDPLATCL